MSPEDLRKISYPEPKILNSLVNCAHSDGQTVGTRFRADPSTSSGSVKKASETFQMQWHIIWNKNKVHDSGNLQSEKS